MIHNNPCTCPSGSTEMKCYVWIHRPTSPDSVIQFNNLKDAYVYALHTIKNVESLPTLLNDEDESIHADLHKDLQWFDELNVHMVCNVDWINRYCDLLNKLDLSHPDKIWDIAFGYNVQVAVGLGSDLPMNVSNKFCTAFGYNVFTSPPVSPTMPPLVPYVVADPLII